MTGADGSASAIPVTTADYATRIRNIGLAPIPVKKNSKVPAIKWADITIDNPADFTNHDGNIGVKLGEWDDPYAMFASYIFALDVDVKNGDGLADLETLQEAHGPLPATWTATTPSGGKHLLFRTSTPVRNQQGAGNRLSPNIDIRGEGGFIVSAPSTIDGEPYRWEQSPWETEIADAPDWLIDLLTAEPEQPAPKPTPSVPSLHSDSPADRLRAKWNWETELAADGWTHSHSQSNGDQMWARPGKSGREGHSAVLHPDGVFVVWTTSVEELNTAGRPTVDGSARTLSPYDYYVAVRHLGDDRKACAAINENDWAIARASTPASPPNDEPTGRSPHELLIDWSTINDRPDALIDGLIFPGRWTAIYSEPKQGKSTLLLGLSLAAARGHDPITNTNREPVGVLYCDGEMGRFDLAERLDDFGYMPEELHSELPGWHATDTTLKLGKDETASRFLALVDELNIGLVVLDGLNGFLEGEENSSGPVLELFEATIQPLKQRNVAVISGDNSGKDRSKGSRGSSTKSDKPDGVLLLSRLDTNGLKLTKQLARTSAYPPKTEIKVLNLDNSDPTTIAPSTAKGYLAGTRELADDIDALDNSDELKSHRAIKKALRAKDIHFSNDVFTDAMRYRASGARRDPFQMGGDKE